ncbi:MAG: aminopeptidase [Sphaerochaeta sp.]|nr:aminopeptidase [Sphaerochaeta sp.]
MDELLMNRYADLVIRKGINLQKGKAVLILTGPGTYAFARQLAKSAYRHGASYVQVMLDDLDVLAERLQHQEADELSFNPAFLKALDYEMCSEGWSYIRIDSTEDRLDHGPFDNTKYQVLGTAKRKFSETRTKKLMRHELAWCVCCAPGPRWAKQVLGEQATEDDLMDVLKPILLLDQEDPLAAWEGKKQMLLKRQAYLNNLGIDSIHFKSSKTDLVLGLRSEARFIGGGETLPDGRPFFPNLPTEEIFTTPDRLRAEGYVTTTKPVSVLDNTTEEVRLTFKDGKVVDHTARVGKEAMDAFFSIDEGTRRLGEVALVDQSSPIAASNLVFNSILLDENASCHLALGEGYSTALTNGVSLTSQEAMHQAGCNTSLMHIDFMIGSDDMDIYVHTRDGNEIQIMKEGLFAF